MGKLGLKKDPRFKQGFYRPKHPDKVIGNDPIIYRSGIELKFFRFLDDNPNVIKWASEPIPIKYFDTARNKWRKYYVDNFVKIKEGKETKDYLIEIKDIKETKKPENKRGKKKKNLLYEQKTFETNCCKWAFAEKFCKEHDMSFLLLGHSKKEGFVKIDTKFIQNL